MLGGDVVSNHSTPDIGSRCPLDTEAPLASVSADSLIYHAWHRFSAYSIGFGGRLKYLSGLLSLPAPDGAQPDPGGPIFEVAVPKPGGLRPNRPCWTAPDHVRWHLRRSRKHVPGQRHCLRQAEGGARPWWLVTRRGQPLITTTKGLDVTPESGSNTRSR